MLSSLHIENVAIINISDIDFSCGFNVLTGETGAGKSIIIDSINLLLGNKGSRELISTGCDYSLVSAVFCGFDNTQIAFLKSHDVPTDEEGNLIISRKITKDGRSVSKINGQAVTVTLLKEIAPMLMSIHGQHDNSKILNPSYHIEYLDEYAQTELYLKDYYQKYLEVKELRLKVNELTKIKETKDELEASLKFKISEIENAKIEVGEKEKLLLARNNVKNNTLLLKNLYLSEQLMNSDEQGVLDGVSTVIASLSALSEILNGVKENIDKLQSIKSELDDVSEFISRSLSSCEENEYTEEYIEERLYTIERIISKYSSEDGALKALENFKSELAELEENDVTLESATESYRVALKELEKLAFKISEHRKEFANKLKSEMLIQLKMLDMPQVDFEVEVSRNTTARGGNKYTPNGYDTVEFLISPNAGQELKPISKIASGGEMSRIMLCLKTILNGSKTDNSTIIYDEVDSGVSGSTAQKIGFKLKESAANRQVFCVTHLAQIASLADHHYKVEKSNENGRTTSTVKELKRSERRYEIARIMGGVEITEQLLKTADEMLKLNEKDASEN